MPRFYLRKHLKGNPALKLKFHLDAAGAARQQNPRETQAVKQDARSRRRCQPPEHYLLVNLGRAVRQSAIENRIAPPMLPRLPNYSLRHRRSACKAEPLFFGLNEKLLGPNTAHTRGLFCWTSRFQAGCVHGQGSSRISPRPCEKKFMAGLDIQPNRINIFTES
jgi:hypothetical protein